MESEGVGGICLYQSSCNHSNDPIGPLNLWMLRASILYGYVILFRVTGKISPEV
jgi:hypothetical protein